MDSLDIIRARAPQAELLAQLAEEASELAHAALKLRRALDGTNPTPISQGKAFSDLREEIADIMLLLQVLRLDGTIDVMEYHEIMDSKRERWVTRLRESEGGLYG